MGGQTLTHVLLQLIGQRMAGLMACMQHDKGFHQFGSLRIWLADYRRFDNCRVFHQGALHVKGADSVARRGDDVIGAADETDAAVGVEFDGVAAQVVVPNEGLGSAARITVEPEQR